MANAEAAAELIVNEVAKREAAERERIAQVKQAKRERIAKKKQAERERIAKKKQAELDRKQETKKLSQTINTKVNRLGAELLNNALTNME